MEKTEVRHQWSPQPDPLVVNIIFMWSLFCFASFWKVVLVKSNDHYWPWLWVGREDQQTFVLGRTISTRHWRNSPNFYPVIQPPGKNIDPLGRPIIILVFTLHPSVPTFQNRTKQNNFQVKIMIATSRAVGLAEGIVDNSVFKIETIFIIFYPRKSENESAICYYSYNSELLS